MDEYNEIVENAKASWRRKEISDQDLLDICRRAGLDAEMENDPIITTIIQTGEPAHDNL
jgi:hypothetical protein